MSDLDERVRLELEVISLIVTALDNLNDAAQGRVLRYLADRYGVTV